MGQRKEYEKTDLTTSEVTHTRDANGAVVIPLDVIPPLNKTVRFLRNSHSDRSFDFGKWYGIGIDAITFACQRQIERFLDKQDTEVEVTTVASYTAGIKGLLDYLAIRSGALERQLNLSDIDRNAIDGYLGFLREMGVATTSQKKHFDRTKAVLLALGRRGLINLITIGDDSTFPRNPFPGSRHKYKGATPLPKTQRQAFSAAVKTAVKPLFEKNIELTSELLAYAFFIVALHTGRNTTPLLEMSRDCLRPHPKEDTLLLVLYKRRGHNTSKVALRTETEREFESTPTIRHSVAKIIRRVIELSLPLLADAPSDLKNRVWLYRSQGGNNAGHIVPLSDSTLGNAILKLVSKYRLLDAEGKPLRINVSRLRKTFVNRVYELTDGDVATTAIAAGNTEHVTSINYLRPGDDARKNWKFMGVALVQELLSNTIGKTERTPTGQCSDTKNGAYAPKRDGATCMSFFNCLRCRNYVVTGDDLYRLFSFYWRVLRERVQMDKHRWERQFAHIPRLIERDVIAPGLASGVFKHAQVEAARERARHDPHPFWKSDATFSDLGA